MLARSFGGIDRPALLIGCCSGRLAGQSHAQAISAVMWHLVRALYHQRSDTIPLHCGQPSSGGNFRTFRHGQNHLFGRMRAARDCVVFGDDILLARADGTASGVGVLPRLRPPLPPNASAAFRSFVDGSQAPADGNYRYVSCDTLAPFDTTGQMSAFVLLSRLPEVAQPHFVELAPQQVFIGWIGAHLDRLALLATRVAC